MIIDTHIHIGRWNNEDSVENLIESASKNGIKILLASCLGERGYNAFPAITEFILANNVTLEAMEKYPDKIYGLCFVNPKYTEESLAEIERCISKGMVGIKLWIAVKASDPLVEPIAEKAIELNVPILQHAWYKTTGNLDNETIPKDIAILAEKFPKLRIQMAHLFGGGFRGLAEIAPFPNVYADVSGGEPEAGFLEIAVQELGADRIVFGSDAPGRGFAVQLGKVIGANIPDDVKEMILWKNARSLYGL
ncbi:MAG: amidohydrolase family protein [Candidatus Poribacteria bacterium]